MELYVIGSSSKGNCYILTAGSQKLIIECGVQFKEIQQALDFNFNNVLGCLVTHEHKDHCKSANLVTLKGTTCYMSRGTFDSLTDVRSYNTKIIESGNQFEISDFTILPFDVQHDAAEPLGFLIMYKPTGEKLLFATDTYYIKYRYSDLNYIMVECNHIEDLIEDSIIRNRLKHSHFSLGNVKDFLAANDMGSVRKIVLLHLSEGNSDAPRMIYEIEKQTRIDTEVALPGKTINLTLQPF